METTPVFGVIGGSGLYEFKGLTDIQSIEIDTPFGKPSAPIMIGKIHNKQVAFLARHGIGHHINPSEVNYRANIYAFKTLGIDKIVSVSACGSLRFDFAPGDIVIPDQIYDHTHKRERSFFGNGLVVHVGVADPFCPSLNAAVLKSLQAEGATVHAGGTLITIEGPRFSTRGESNTFRGWGMSLVGMTASPEVFLAREAEICYTTMAHVTDYDSWHINEAPVTVEMVVQTLIKNTEIAQRSLVRLVDELTSPSASELPKCACNEALKDAIITNPAYITPAARENIGLLVNKYLG